MMHDFTKTIAQLHAEAIGVSPLPETDGEYRQRAEDDIDFTERNGWGFRIESRIPGQTPWALEDGEVYATEDAAEQVIETLEPENDNGEPLEYRVVPA